MTITDCVLTGNQLDQNFIIDESVGPFFTYTYPPVGKVHIAFPTLLNFINAENFHHPILAGICRNAFENGVDPPLITQSFIDNELKNLTFPKSFKEKALHLLKVLYDKGGNDFKLFDINTNGYPICYAENADEFARIMNYLEDKSWIKWQFSEVVRQGLKNFEKVQLTEDGIYEVEKDLPNIPLIGLINQKIATGNITIDQKINHAKELFFREPQTLDRMRSACETLSFVLEPLRQDLKKYFTSKDTEEFFNIVNNFDIRHNKAKTKDLEYPEQLEWIFYSLLNTINTYSKLNDRLK